jgi:hypothetical protein
MEFLNPLALAALAAAAIPLIIHLFNFRRPRRVNFSSLTFVKELQKSTMQRVRIKQWLLLALRILAVACLVLAFARPTLTGTVAGAMGGRAASSVAVVLDNSLSMTLRDAEGEYLRQARDIAAGVIDQFADGDEIFLVSTAAAGAAPDRFSNAGSAIAGIERIEASIGSRTLPQAVSAAARALEDATHLNRELYVISDLQATALSDSVQSVLDEGVRTYLLPVGDRLQENVAVTDVRVESRIIEVGQPVRLSATLVNYGSEPVEGYVASVFLEGQRLAQAAATLAPGVPTSVTFSATPQTRGWLSGVVEIEDDAFAFDNERYFTVYVPARRRILVVRGEGQQIDFLQLALSPELGRGRVAFDVETIAETGLAAASLGTYDAVVVVGPQTLSSGEVAVLERYVAAGGGLLVTPAAGASGETYETLLEALGGGSVSGFSGSPGSGRSIAAFERVEFEHPLFEGVFSGRSLDGDLSIESLEIYSALNYTAGSGSEQTLIGLSNGYPFLQEIRHERGVAFLLAVAPDARWSDLPVRGLFIPLLYRSMYYLSASESVSGEQMTAGTDAELSVPRLSEVEQLRIIGPDGTEYVPEQRDLFGAALLTLAGSAVQEPGVYDVRAGDEILRRIPFNIEESESDLRSVSYDEGRDRLAASLGAPVEIITVGGRPAQEVVASLAQQRTGVELWKVFLLASLLFLVAEAFVAKRWRPETVPA